MSSNNQRSNSTFIQYPVREIIAQYMSYHKTNGHSPETIRYYNCHLGQFASWMETNGLKDLGFITTPVLRSYFAEYQEHNTRNGTNVIYRAIKAFLRWVWDEYEIDRRNPIDKITIKSDPLVPKKGVDPNDVEKLFESAKSSDYPERDCALLAVLLDTGIRRSSFINILIKDVDPVSGSIFIRHTKSHRPMTVYLGTTAKKYVRKYIKTLYEIPEDHPFWITEYDNPLSMNGMREVIRRICKRAGIPEYSAHDFRRYFALQTYRNGADVYAVSELLGHSGIEVTRRYLAVNEDDRKIIHAKTSPLDHK